MPRAFPNIVCDFYIAAPQPKELDEFIQFIDEELASRSGNTLILRVDFNYQFESHPELRDSVSLSKKDVKRLVAVCKKNSITIIPQLNLLVHQSWAGKTGNLLKLYPEFDEAPLVKMPETYQVWSFTDYLLFLFNSSFIIKSVCSSSPNLKICLSNSMKPFFL